MPPNKGVCETWIFLSLLSALFARRKLKVGQSYQSEEKNSDMDTSPLLFVKFGHYLLHAYAYSRVRVCVCQGIVFGVWRETQ